MTIADRQVGRRYGQAPERKCRSLPGLRQFPPPEPLIRDRDPKIVRAAILAWNEVADGDAAKDRDFARVIASCRCFLVDNPSPILAGAGHRRSWAPVARVKMPWRDDAAPAQRVIFCVYPEYDELRLRARLDEFEIVTGVSSR